MKRRPLLTWLLIAVLFAVGWWGVHHAARQSLERGIARFAASFPPGARLSYASARPLLLTRGADLRSVVYRDGDVVLTIGDLRVQGFSGYPPLGLHLRGLSAHDVHYTDAATTIVIGELQTRDVTVPPMGGAAHVDADPAAIVIAHVEARRIAAAGGGITDASAETLDLTDYALGHGSSYALTGVVVRARRLPSWAPDPLRLLAHDTAPEAASDGFAIRAGRVQQTGIDLAGAIARRVEGPAARRDADLSTGRRTAMIDDLHAALGNMPIDVAHLDGTSDRTPDGAHVALALRGLRTPPNAGLPARPLIDFGLDATIDTSTGVMTLRRLAIESAGLGSLVAHGTFDHVPSGRDATPGQTTSRQAPPQDAPPRGLPKPRLVALDLSYRDAGLDDMVIARLAADRRTSASTLRAALAQMAQVTAITSPPLAPFMDFIARPGGRTLHIALAPPRPLDGAAIMAQAGGTLPQRFANLGLSMDLR